MTKHTSIKAGYRLNIHSWENDGDVNMVKTIEGLTKEQVTWVLKALAVSEEFANDCLSSDREDKLTRAVEKFLESNPYTYKGTEKWIREEPQDFFCDLLGYSEHINIRVFERFTVEYIETEIQIPDVTEQFK